MKAFVRFFKKPVVKWTILASLFCFLSILFFPNNPESIKVQEVPNPQQTHGGWVTDMANIISDRTEAQLNQMITDLEAKNGTEIAVVTVPETSSYPSPKTFATELFNYWRIGKQGRNNGVLVAISKGDRRVEIEIGNGVTKILPDTKVQNIIDTQFIPQFKQKNFDRGILAGTQMLIVAIHPSMVSSLNQGQDANLSWVQQLIGIAILVLVMGAGVYIVRTLLLGMGIYSSGEGDACGGSSRLSDSGDDQSGGSSRSSNSSSSCGDSSSFGGGSSDSGGAGAGW